MPPSGLRRKLTAIDVPGFLSAAVAPWTIAAAELWGDGAVRLDLRSARAAVPLVLDRRGPRVAITLLDQRIDPQRGGNLIRALELRFVRSQPLRPWLDRLADLAAVVERGDGRVDASLAPLVELLRSWPTRDHDPERPVDSTPEGVDTRDWPRAAKAASILHRLAEGEVLDTLERWTELGEARAEPGFAELMLDLVGQALLGHRTEALAAAAGLERGCEDPDRWRAIARLYEHLDERERAVAAYGQLIARRDRVWARLSRARAAGDFQPDEAIPRPIEATRQRDALPMLRELDKILAAADRLDDWLEILLESLDALPEPPVDLLLRAATLHLWRREAPEARARLAQLEGRDERGGAKLIEGALMVLEGEPARGLELLAEAEAAGCEALDLLVWRAEALLGLDRLDEALPWVEAHVRGANTMVGYLLLLHIWARTMSATELSEAIGVGSFLDGLVPEVLPSMMTEAEREQVASSSLAYAEVARRLLDEMGGNRSERPTWCRRGEDGQVHLVRLESRKTAREAAVDNLIRIRTEPPADVLAGFEPLKSDYPDAPFCFTYRGELQVWLGRYREALASFEAANKRAKTRWAYVGRSAAYDLLGESAKSDHWAKLGAEMFGELATATTHVYRGERQRRLGNWDAARRDLDIALEPKPRRIGARMNRALLCRATGDEQGWAADIERLIRDAPAFLFEAGARRYEPVTEAMLHACLERMVGNRSSFLHTKIEEDGTFRVVPSPQRWVGYARLSLSTVRDDIGRLLATAWVE